MFIKALSTEEIHLISCLLQDSITRYSWIRLDKNKFKIALNRFCWELEAEHRQRYRVHTLLIIHHIENMQNKNLQDNKDLKILLNVSYYNNKLYFTFDNDALLVLKVSEIKIFLYDVSKKWDTHIRELHHMIL